MLVYLYLYCFGLINVLISYLGKKYDRTTYIFFSCSLLFFAALRYGIGTDYFAYVDIYNESLRTNGRIEFGYLALNKILKYIHCPVEVLFFIVGLLVIANYYKAFTLLEINRTLGLFVFFCFFYLVNIYNLVRHGIAISFLILELTYMIKDKTRKALWCLVIACFFHYISVLIGLMIIFYKFVIMKHKFKIYQILIFTVLLNVFIQKTINIILGLSSANTFINVIKFYFSVENQNRVGFGTLLNISLLFLFLLTKKSISTNRKFFYIYLDVYIFYFLTMIVFWSIPTITERVTNFFYQSIIVLVTIFISDSIYKKKYLSISFVITITTIMLLKYIFIKETSGEFAFLPYEMAYLR